MHVAYHALEEGLEVSRIACRLTPELQYLVIAALGIEDVALLPVQRLFSLGCVEGDQSLRRSDLAAQLPHGHHPEMVAAGAAQRIESQALDLVTADLIDSGNHVFKVIPACRWAFRVEPNVEIGLIARVEKADVGTERHALHHILPLQVAAQRLPRSLLS